ncbi:hypothetical protein ACWGKS_13330 [Nocardiopsis sp. NPDC055879]
MTASEVVALLRYGPRHVSDLLWHTVCARARQGEATWTVIAAGALLPRMVTACTRYARGPGQHIADVESEVLTTVLEQLRSLPENANDVGERLWAAAANTAVRSAYVHTRDRRWSARWRPNQVPLDPAMAGRGPVTVVAEAAQRGVLTQVEADLITRTRLERHKLVRVAQEMGLTYITARRWRRAAEDRLVSVLVREEL